MELNTNVSLKAFNTFRVDAIAARYVRFDMESEIIDFIGRRNLSNLRHIVLGGGSNLLFVNDFDGIVLHPKIKGIDVIDQDRQHLWIRVMAGEVWDDLVAVAVAKGWGGIENLSLIPGSVGASVVQNIGAYGVEVKDVVQSVEAICIQSRKKVTLNAEDCGFGYRFSNFKGDWAGRFLITAVVFKLFRQPQFALDYPGIKSAVADLGSVDLQTLRQVIISIRQRKLPDPAVVGNAGSFFKNPVVDSDDFDCLLKRYPDLPNYPQGGERFKLAAAWLIERCGWKGKRVGRAAVHDHHALVLINQGGATGREILELSERIRQSVADHFGIELEREVCVVQ